MWEEGVCGGGCVWRRVCVEEGVCGGGCVWRRVCGGGCAHTHTHTHRPRAILSISSQHDHQFLFLPVQNDILFLLWYHHHPPAPPVGIERRSLFRVHIRGVSTGSRVIS